jgi:hypothetical protein
MLVMGSLLCKSGTDEIEINSIFLTFGNAQYSVRHTGLCFSPSDPSTQIQELLLISMYFLGNECTQVTNDLRIELENGEVCHCRQLLS